MGWGMRARRLLVAMLLLSTAGLMVTGHFGAGGITLLVAVLLLAVGPGIGITVDGDDGGAKDDWGGGGDGGGSGAGD